MKTIKTGYEPILHTPTAEELRNVLSEIAWHTTHEFECPNGYEFQDENGNVINVQKIVLEKKKKEYPKTYEECCEILEDVADCSLSCFACGVLNNLQKLLLCRDAYWKIAGEKMGLGKPWEPDWEDYEHKKFVFIVEGNTLIEKEYSIQSCFLAFPTAEMRDAFYENFKEEIEICKELL